MKSILFKIVLGLCCVPLCASAKTDPGLTGKYTKEKTIKKQFNVDADALLKLDNSYGNLHITSWDQNTTTIEVVIQTSSDSEKRAQQKLDQISIQFDASSAMVTAKTIFDNNISGWWGSNVSVKVNYTVRVPKNNRLDLSNDYGSIYLDEINGATSISCDYGSMQIGSLNSSHNELSFDYTTDVSIAYINKATIDADYSDFNLQKAGDIKLEADYSNSSFHNIDRLEFSCDYGKVNVENGSTIMGEGDYLSTRIGTVSGDCDINSDYGDIKIKELMPEAGSVTIDGDYTNIVIGYNSGYHFNIIAELGYAELQGNNDIQYQIKREKNTESYYEGYRGSQGKNTVKLNIEYGGVKINKQ